MSREFRGGGDTGRLFETRFFGVPTIDSSLLAVLERLPHGRGQRFRSDEDVYTVFKRHYRSDPTDPPPPPNVSASHFKDLRESIVERLGLSEEESARVKCYTSLHTTLDHMFGVDGFIEYADPVSGKFSRVTLDATRDPHKIPKADVVIFELPDAAQDTDAYLQKIDDYAHQVAVLLQKRLDERRSA